MEQELKSNRLKKVGERLWRMQNPPTLTCAMWVCGSDRVKFVNDFLANKPKEEIYMKRCTQWWTGYKGQEVVWIENANTQVSDWMKQVLLTWVKGRPFTAETQGGHIENVRPEILIVTSATGCNDFFKTDVRGELFMEHIAGKKTKQKKDYQRKKEEYERVMQRVKYEKAKAYLEERGFEIPKGPLMTAKVLEKESTTESESE